jgi:hypothetical protein
MIQKEINHFHREKEGFAEASDTGIYKRKQMKTFSHLLPLLGNFIFCA